MVRTGVWRSLNHWPGCGLWCRNQRHVRHEGKWVWTRVAMGKQFQWFLFWSPQETSTWVHFIEKIFSMLHKMSTYKGLFMISIISLSANSRCQSRWSPRFNGHQAFLKICYSIMKLTWPPWKRCGEPGSTIQDISKYLDEIQMRCTRHTIEERKKQMIRSWSVRNNITIRKIVHWYTNNPYQKNTHVKGLLVQTKSWELLKIAQLNEANKMGDLYKRGWC
jgi:hypothetical protein